MTRVVLTGAGGFVGSHVLETLLDQTTWEVVALDSFRHNGAFDRAATAIHPGAGPDRTRGERVTVMAHDLSVPFSKRQLDVLGSPDYIVSIASGASVPDSIKHPADFARNNVDVMLTLLELARASWTWDARDIRVAPHRLVHLSTDEVYGPSKAQSYTDHRPSSPYAASKAAQEDLIHAWTGTYGVPATIVNSANMFGERQSQLAFVPRVIGAVLNGQPIPIHTWHGEPGRRRYTYVRNTAQFLVHDLQSHSLVASVRPTWPHRVVREALAGQHSIDNLELAQRIAGLIGRPLRHTLIDGPVARPGYDPDYAPLGGGSDWAQIPFNEGLERTVKWFVDHSEWLQ